MLEKFPLQIDLKWQQKCLIGVQKYLRKNVRILTMKYRKFNQGQCGRNTVDWFEVKKNNQKLYVLDRLVVIFCCYIYRKKYVNVKLPEILNYLIMKFQFYLLNSFKPTKIMSTIRWNSLWLIKFHLIQFFLS